MPAFAEAGNWEFRLTNVLGNTFVDSFSHGANTDAVYGGYVSPVAIATIDITRPTGQLSPNHRIDDLSLDFGPEAPEPVSAALLAMDAGALCVRCRRPTH